MNDQDVRRRQAFSLVEVVIALGVFAFSILVLIGISGPLIESSSAARDAFFLEASDDYFNGWIESVQGDLSGEWLEALLLELEGGPVVLYGGSVIDWEHFEVILFAGRVTVLEEQVEAVYGGSVGWSGPIYELKVERNEVVFSEETVAYIPVRVRVKMLRPTDPLTSLDELRSAFMEALESEVFLAVIMR